MMAPRNSICGSAADSCGGLTGKCPPQAHVLQYLVISRWHCLGVGGGGTSEDAALLEEVCHWGVL